MNSAGGLSTIVLYPEINPLAAKVVHIEILVLRGRSFKSFLEIESETNLVAVYPLPVFHAVLEAARKMRSRRAYHLKPKQELSASLSPTITSSFHLPEMVLSEFNRERSRHRPRGFGP
jgi:hypothetical protein